MPTPDVQMPVVEALIQWLNPKWFVEMIYDDDSGLAEKEYVIEKEVFSFSDDVYYTLYLILDEYHEGWMKPEKLIGESEKELGRFNPFIDGNYQLDPATSQDFQDNKESIYLTKERGTGQKILWLPECVLEENGRWSVDAGFENQRFEYIDTFFNEDELEIFFVSDYLGQIPNEPQPKSRSLLNWTEVPETLLRR